MKDYAKLVQNLRKILNRFGSKLLLYDMLKGVVVTIAFTVAYLLIYSLLLSFGWLTVGLKTVLYFVFLLLSAISIITLILYKLYLFILSLDLSKDVLFKRINKFTGLVDDVFISVYSLAFHKDKITGDEQLKEAAFIQKFNELQNGNKIISFPRRSLLQMTILFVLVVGFFSIKIDYFSYLFNDLANYGEVYNPNQNIRFTLLNKTLEIETGQSLQIQLSVYSPSIDIENVFITFGGGQFLMSRKDTIYTYNFDAVNNDLRFTFTANGVESKQYKITVLPSPEITDYQVAYTPPIYTGLKSEIFKNTVDFRAVHGSNLRFTVNYADLDTLFLQKTGGLTPISLKSSSYTEFVHKVNKSEELTLFGSNSRFYKKELIRFSVTDIVDLYPGIQVTGIQDSLNASMFYFYGIISDDYGFSQLRFVYSSNGRTNTVIPIKFSKNLTAQEFYFEFNFGEFSGMDKTEIKYYFEVADNDAINGPKTTRSDAENYKVPDLNTVFEYNTSANSTMNSSLQEAEKLAKEIVESVKDMQIKILENNSDDWEKQQLAKDIVEKKEKLDKLLKDVQDENLKKSSINKNFTKQDSTLLAKQKMMQELMDKVLNDDLKKLMDEFRKLADEFSKDKFNQLDENMRLEYDQLSEVLDRNIDILKSMQVEEQHQMISQQIEQLKEKQQQFKESIDNPAISADSIAEQSKELKEDLQDIINNYDELKKENSELNKPFELKEMNEEFNNLSKDMQQQQQNSEQGKKDKNLADKIKKQLDELDKDMQQQQKQQFMQMNMPQSDLELITQNILLVSFSQEHLMTEYRTITPQSALYTEVNAQQEMMRSEYKIIKDSLEALSRSNIKLASLLDDKFYIIETKFDLIPNLIQNNRKNDLLKEQQYIITYLNDIALILSEGMEEGQGEGDGNGNGEGQGEGGKSQKNAKGKKSGGNSYENIKDLQQKMKKEMEEMLNQLKNGEKGKPFYQNIGKTIRENELFQQSLEKFMNESGSMSEIERKALNEIKQLIEQNIKDLSNYSFGRQIIERNNLIYNKLLISEKASKEREEYEEKRKAVKATEKQYDNPIIPFNAEERKNLMKTDFQRSGVILNTYYKNLYNNYFIKLGDE
ncbi:MAG: hypothetical protein LBM07_08350 [Culturomica sp.]|jgi:hypothetical protein|nr:hypothetical protein [Culturomica sp.]